LSQPHVGEEEIAAVAEVLRSGRLALGPRTAEFERRFGEFLNHPHAIAVNSGTSGLHLAVKALGIGPGDEVITTPFSFIASANCILMAGAKPVFVDVEEESFNIDPALIEPAITSRTRALLPVHVFGEAANMTAILSLARRHNLNIIEDACEAIGARHAGRLAGTFGDAGVFGFYPNKQITTGEGGIIVTGDQRIGDYCVSTRNQGRDDDSQWLTHVRLGYNYRISEITAAIGVEQVRKLPEILHARRGRADRYLELLSDIPGVKLPTQWDHQDHSWFVFAIRVEDDLRDPLVEELNRRGIGCKAYFHPCIHLQEFYRRELGFHEGMFPIAERLSRQTLVLPFFTGIADEQIQYVADTLRTVLPRLKPERNHHERCAVDVGV
jgi:perosamine synthetase